MEENPVFYQSLRERLEAIITSVVDAPRLVSSDASPTRPECAVTRLSPRRPPRRR